MLGTPSGQINGVFISSVVTDEACTLLQIHAQLCVPTHKYMIMLMLRYDKHSGTNLQIISSTKNTA